MLYEHRHLMTLEVNLGEIKNDIHFSPIINVMLNIMLLLFYKTSSLLKVN